MRRSRSIRLGRSISGIPGFDYLLLGLFINIIDMEVLLLVGGLVLV